MAMPENLLRRIEAPLYESGVVKYYGIGCIFSAAV
jgi:hypothetical protein